MMEVSRRILVRAVVTTLALGLYGSFAGLGNVSHAGMADPAELQALAKGSMQAFVANAIPGEPLDITLVDKDGKARPLSDWKGKVLVLNLWASWCAPCRKEMPALDRLKAALGGDRFDVLAVSTDRGGIDKALAFLGEVGVTKLEPLHDGGAGLAQILHIFGMPTTLLIDARGREIGRLIGPAEWDGAEAQALVKAAIGAPAM